MSSAEERSERDKALEDLIKNAAPEIIEKFGNPLDKDDPRMWLPSTREEKGVSAEDRLRFLELDVEAISFAFGNLTKGMTELYNWMRQEAESRLIEQAKADPEGTLRKLLAGDISIPGVSPKEMRKGQWGPEDNEDAAVRYAGSTQGIKPDQMIDTPNGRIRADQIPGYKNEPGWKPSPDWVDANCMCENHQKLRAESEKYSPGTGFYL